MYSIPIQVDATHYDLWILLEEENVERIKASDPVEVPVDKMPDVLQALRPRGVFVVYVTAEDIKTIFKLFRDGKMPEAMRYLSRGWKYDPKQGDGKKPQIILSNR